MSDSRFFEGVIVGALCGIFGYIFVKEQNELNEQNLSTQNLNTESDQTQASAQKKTENSVSKTLEAIEKGFDKITKIIDDRKVKQKN